MIQSILTDTTDGTTTIYDVIRTGLDFSLFWHIRPTGEEPEALDLIMKFPEAIEPYAFKPIPALILPGEHAIIAPDWLECLSENGTIFQSLQTRTTVTNDQIPIIRLPHIFTTESMNELVKQLALRHTEKLRDSLWSIQSELKSAKQAHSVDLSTLTQLKSEHRTNCKTKESIETQLTSQTELWTKEKLELQSSLKKAKDDRDFYRSERDSKRTEVTNIQKEVTILQSHVSDLQNQAAKDLRRIQGKDKFIERLKLERPPNQVQNNQQKGWNKPRNTQPFKKQRYDGNSSQDPTEPSGPPKQVEAHEHGMTMDLTSTIAKEIANQFRVRDEDSRRKELTSREEALAARERALAGGQNYYQQDYHH